MKSFLLYFFVLAAAVAATPNRAQERFVEGIVAGMIEDLSIRIKEDGMDPYLLTDAVEHRFPVTDLFVFKAHVEDLAVVGLSDIVINRISYGLISGNLAFDISLPRLSATLGSSSLDLKLFSYTADIQASGGLEIRNTRVTGNVILTGIIGNIINGISISSMNLDLAINDVWSNLHVFVMGEDYSVGVNTALGVTLPMILENNRVDINTLLEHYAKEGAQTVLDGLL